MIETKDMTRGISEAKKRQKTVQWLGSTLVSDLGGSADRNSGQASGRAMRLRSSGLYVCVGTPDLLGDRRFALG